MPRSSRSRSPRPRSRYDEPPRSSRDRNYYERDEGRDRRRGGERERYRDERRGGWGQRYNGRHDIERAPTIKAVDHRDGPSDRPRSPSSRPHSSSRRSRSRSPSVDKTKPNFNPSGLLAAETNTVERADGTSTLLKYNEPPEARRPSQGWRLYVFKGKEQVDLLHIHRQSAYLVGRDRVISDIPVEHPSCSKQHAVIQFRHVAGTDELGNSKPTVKPFIIDLESTNGTLVNDETIPPSRYYELRPSDVIKFGLSLREYVLLHDDA